MEFDLFFVLSVLEVKQFTSFYSSSAWICNLNFTEKYTAILLQQFEKVPGLSSGLSYQIIEFMDDNFMEQRNGGRLNFTWIGSQKKPYQIANSTTIQKLSSIGSRGHVEVMAQIPIEMHFIDLLVKQMISYRQRIQRSRYYWCSAALQNHWRT